MRVAIATLALSTAASLSSLCTTCIAADTLVDTPDGPRPLGALAVGDRVRSVDATTQAETIARVIATRRAKRETIALSTGHGHRLVCTTDHPLYDPDARAWAPAGDWALGLRASLLAADGEHPRAVRVTAVETFAGVRDVVDITTDDAPHTFVAAGLVVHNKEQTNFPLYDAGAGDGALDAEDGHPLVRCLPDLVPGARSCPYPGAVFFGTPCAERCVACALLSPDGGAINRNPAPCVCDGTAWRCPSDIACAVGESRWNNGPPPSCP